MIDDLQLLRGKDYIINQHIKIHHPTLNEICDINEQEYFKMVNAFCATPSEYKVLIYDSFGLDYETISELEWFFVMCKQVSFDYSKLLFGDIDFSKLKARDNNVNGELILYIPETNIVIDNSIYIMLTSYLRRIHTLKKNSDKAGNEHSKQYLIDKERRKLSRVKNTSVSSLLLPLVSALVNCEEFKYNYDNVWDLPIFVFMDAIKRIQKYKNYNQIMQGIYAGTIDSKKISEENLNWLAPLSEN